jgi:CheY-like chemotaxis protein
MSDDLWRRASVFTDDTPVILLVDDEATTLQTLSLQLGQEFRVVTASGGPAAMAVLDNQGPVAAIVADKRMPDMDGIELLEHVRLRYPDTSRVLHTGQADLAVAISAINSGNVFGFLTKPCPTRELRRTVREAVERHRVVAAERDVSGRTLRATLQALFGWMELANPLAFARAGRIRDLVAALGRELELDDVWQIEVAAMASQLGAVTLPPSVLDKLDRGLPLPDNEQQLTDAIPSVAAKLLRDVPMLEDVVEAMRTLGSTEDRRAVARAQPASPAVSLTVGVLRAAIEFDTLVSRGVGTDSAFAHLVRGGGHSGQVVDALRRVCSGMDVPDRVVHAVRVAELEVGMHFAEDVVAPNGLTLVGGGVAVTEGIMDRLVNFKRKGQLTEPILVTLPAAESPAAEAPEED